MKMWPQQLAKPGVRGAHWPLLCTQLGHTTDMLSISSVSRAPDAQTQVHTSSHTVSTNCDGCPRLQCTETSQAGKPEASNIVPRRDSSEGSLLVEPPGLLGNLLSRK